MVENQKTSFELARERETELSDLITKYRIVLNLDDSKAPPEKLVANYVK
jgi:hypothetical protein